MIEYFKRKLSDDDIKHLNKKYKSQEKYLIYKNKIIMKRLLFYIAAFFICTAIFFTLLYRGSDNFMLFFTGAVFIVSPVIIFRLLRTFIKNSLLQNKLHQILDNILEKDTAKVVHCSSTKMIQFEEIEDEGARYMFQVEENKIFNIQGKEYSKSEFFPSSDFELISIMGKGEHTPVDFYIHCTGHKISPVMIIPDDIRKEYTSKISELPEIIEGNIEDLDSVIRIILK